MNSVSNDQPKTKSCKTGILSCDDIEISFSGASYDEADRIFCEKLATRAAQYDQCFDILTSDDGWIDMMAMCENLISPKNYNINDDSTPYSENNIPDLAAKILLSGFIPKNSVVIKLHAQSGIYIKIVAITANTERGFQAISSLGINISEHSKKELMKLGIFSDKKAITPWSFCYSNGCEFNIADVFYRNRENKTKPKHLTHCKTFSISLQNILTMI